MSLYPYRESKQIEEYILQFMRVFSGFQVRDGVERNGEFVTKRVPVVYGNMSRVVAEKLNKRDYLNNNKIPMLAANLLGIAPDPANKKSPHYEEERSIPTNNLERPTEVVQRLSGPPFILTLELGIYASSLTELMQLLEQILLIFNPRVTIQTSSKLLDGDYITEISLESIQSEIQYPMGTEKRVCMQTLTFSVPFRLKYPRGTNDKIIEQIIANVKDDSDTDIFIDTLTGDIETGEIDIDIKSAGE